MLASTPALRASSPDLREPGRAAAGSAAARIATVVGPVALVMWNMRKIPFFSLLQNSRSEDGGQGRTFFVRREAGLPLDGNRSGGYAASAAPGCPFPPRSFVFNTFTPEQPRLPRR
jgi:hypothetical protein